MLTTHSETIEPKDARVRWASAMLATKNKEAVEQAEKNGGMVYVEYIYSPTGQRVALVMGATDGEGHSEPVETCRLCKEDK